MGGDRISQLAGAEFLKPKISSFYSKKGSFMFLYGWAITGGRGLG